MTCNPLANEVRIGVAIYTIGEIPVERGPVWKLLKKDGNPMDGAAFDNLPSDHQATLYARVTRHFVSLLED
jgi:hypothetical protein